MDWAAKLAQRYRYQRPHSIAHTAWLFLSVRRYEFERGRDGAHPTRESAAAWLDSVVRWMPENARYPIRLDVPDKPSGRARRSYVHQPGER